MEGPRDEFKWFGEGFKGFPKRLPEDCVEYAIHIVDLKIDNDFKIRERLRDIQKTANELTKKLLKDYIWQRDNFTLELERQDDNHFLKGRTVYADCVEDEWLIVYLLCEISKAFPEAWIRVHDTDGEFLLIEAASALPKWLNPEIAENRVWINNGQLKLIPLQQSSIPKSITTKEALSILNINPSRLIHSPLIQEEAFYRLRNYPSQIRGNLHHALLPIPRKLAYILHTKPTLISSAIEAFYLRDPISMKPLQTSDANSLPFPPQDFVKTSIRFTKVGYAQLKSQTYVLPSLFEAALPKNVDSSTVSRADAGMRLTSAFNMLVCDSQNRDKKPVREIKILLDDAEEDPSVLPLKSEIAKWPQTADDESWLDVDFSAFDTELSGKAGKKGRDHPKVPSGMRDATAQENLRKMVERFEAFLNDDNAGAEGAEELEDMDFDNDEDEDDDNDGDVSNDGEDKEISFDENEFARLMREMMGLPPDSAAPEGTPEARRADDETCKIEKVGTEDEQSDEEEEIHKVMQRMEDELNEFGVLNLNPTPRNANASSHTLKGKERIIENGYMENEDNDSTGEENLDLDDIDFNLAKNLLESLKSQTGNAGPTGNMMGLMRVNMPRDEGDKCTL
ncbi:regulatory factor Sgt1 [Patellaria atrata CBS 101060]|uniref:Regulatory factor Sgt1 n=1 Tax=Patellaria atrata CBS 101060 TaxID=1346257 RepID=A0A9P4S409_9PEZI|nr:regulatory factor Sgt1 [Patellaria atrata CBS 101060]